MTPEQFATFMDAVFWASVLGAFVAGFLGRMTFDALQFLLCLASSRVRRLRRLYWRRLDWGLRS